MWRVGPEKVRESRFRGGAAVRWAERVEHRCRSDMGHCESFESIICVAVVE